MLEKQEKRYRRHKRVRAKVFGSLQVPRLCVFRSNKHIYAQLIDDEEAKTILSASDLELGVVKDKKSKDKLAGKSARAFEVGKLIAKKALEVKVKRVVFDRNGYKYHGRVKALAEGARQGGLSF